MKQIRDWYARLSGDQMVWLVIVVVLAFNVATALMGWQGMSYEDDNCVRYTSHVSSC